MSTWLDLCGDDSNLSMASADFDKELNSNISKSNLTNLSNSKSKFDAEFDSSRQGVNLLFKTNVKINNNSNSINHSINHSISSKSKSKKRILENIQNNDIDSIEPPKAKQRTNDLGEWKQRKKENNNNNNNNKENINDFSRFLMSENINTNTKRPRKVYRAKRNINNIIKETNAENMNIRKRRVTPTLQHVRFNVDLFLNKVPIIINDKNKNENENNKIDENDGPIFLNADQMEKMNKINKINDEINNEIEEIKENKENIENKINKKENEMIKNEIKKEIKTTEIKQNSNKNSKISVWHLKTNDDDNNNDDNNDNNNNNDKSWAQKLFCDEIKKNEISKYMEQELLVQERKQQRILEIEIESMLPLSSSLICESITESATTSVTTTSTIEIKSPSSKSSKSSKSLKSLSDNNSDIDLIEPSLSTLEWRRKQILIGKSTEGYKNFMIKHPKKDWKYRNNHKLLSSPQCSEKIGKKRWVGKYKKWRRFLHQFDKI